MVGEFVKVETIPMSFGGVGTVGMAGACTNAGVLLPARSSPDELVHLEISLPPADVSIGTGSANLGPCLIGTGVLVYSTGYLAGNPTTGFELGRIEDVFGFL